MAEYIDDGNEHEAVDNKDGKCPRCGSDDLDYDILYLSKDNCSRNFVCNCCNTKGYDLFGYKYYESHTYCDDEEQEEIGYQEDHCPHCGADSLEYERPYFDDESCYINIECKICKTKGWELFGPEYYESHAFWEGEEDRVIRVNVDETNVRPLF